MYLMENKTCPALETLDFLNYDKTNVTEVEELLKEWPCELRIYWNSPDMQSFVSIVRFLFNYAVIALLITGLLVNICSLIILNSPPINKGNMSVYLKALAISDMGALIFSIGIGVLRAKSTFISDLFIKYEWMCALHKSLLSGFVFYSSWIVVTFSFERLLMIKNPFKIHTWHNEKPAKITVIILAVAALIITALKSLTTGFEKDNAFGYKPCEVKSRPVRINLLPISLINLILPSVLIIIANVCTAVHLHQSTHVNKNLRASIKKKNDYLKVTRMVIIISFVYVILHLPLGVAACTDLYFKSHKPSPTNLILHLKWKKNLIFMRWIRHFCLFLHLLHFVNNFFLYCLSGNIFRKGFKACLPSHIRNCCTCLPESRITRYIQECWIAFVSSTLQEAKVNSFSSIGSQNSITKVSQNEYNNAAFSFTEENDTNEKVKNFGKENKMWL